MCEHETRQLQYEAQDAAEYADQLLALAAAVFDDLEAQDLAEVETAVVRRPNFFGAEQEHGRRCPSGTPTARS